MANPSIVVILDQSDSMRSLNYFLPAKTDAATFINVMHVNDRLGIVSYSDAASIVYPSGGSSVTQLTSNSMIFQASQSVMPLVTINMTNMAAALSTARSLLSSAPGPHAMVFLSDGMFNVGGDPRPGLPSDIPIYTIALGPYGETAVMSDIARLTGGTYQYSPDPVQLQRTYDAIAGPAQVASLVLDEVANISQSQFHATVATVGAGATIADFLVSWGDWSITYTPDTPVGQQVNVFVYDPNGQKVTAVPKAIGPGYAVLEITEPMAGPYSLYAWYSGTGQFVYTAGVLDNNLALSSDLEIAADQPEVGDQLEFSVRLRENDEPIRGALLQASVEHPMVSVPEAAGTYGALLDPVAGPADFQGEDAGAARFASFAQQVGIDRVLPRARTPVGMNETSPGVYAGALPVTHKPGAHTVRVEVRGHSRVGAGAFQRSSQSSIHVREATQGRK